MGSTRQDQDASQRELGRRRNDQEHFDCWDLQYLEVIWIF
jgi:hypothetical protein